MRWLGVCAYHGAHFHGWGRLSHASTVQGTLEFRLQELFGLAIPVVGASRTDAGVHAHGQVFHFDAEWEHGGKSLQHALQQKLPPALQILRLDPAPPGFDARRSPKWKRYRYRMKMGEISPFLRPFVWPVAGNLDVEAMAQAAVCFRGRHDFSSFRANDAQNSANPVCTLSMVRLFKSGHELSLVLQGDRFLFRMARSLAGTLVSIGKGKFSKADLISALAGCPRSPEIVTAPAAGLHLEKIGGYARSPSHPHARRA